MTPKMQTKISFLIACFLLVSLGARAQHYRIGLGAELDFPSGNSVNMSSFGFGTGLKGEVGLSDKLSLTANAGFLHFLGKKFYGPRMQGTNNVPVKLGLMYYADDNFYAEAQAGTHFSSQSNAKNGFAWSLGIGSFLKSSQRNKIDIGLRYEEWRSSALLIPQGTTWSSFNFFSLRAAYAFTL